MLSVLIAFMIRCLLVGLFLPFSALDNVLNFRAASALIWALTAVGGTQMHQASSV
ncbi:MAG TPA: hypothetical protein VGF97_17895 [Rhizomicrobium sp.]|jgi:hypothetical protein